jgi:hypothetical protein
MHALGFSWLDGLLAVCGLVLLVLAGWSGWSLFRPEPVQDPRRARLNQRLINLGIWAQRRVRGDHDVDTTLTLLDRKIAETHAAVGRATQCPQCGAAVVQCRYTGDYCEECGWPEENRTECVNSNSNPKASSGDEPR